MKNGRYDEARVKRLEERVSFLEQNMKTHKQLEDFYLNFIIEQSERFARLAVQEMLQHPIEMTMKEIEEAFGHKIKIVEEKSSER